MKSGLCHSLDLQLYMCKNSVDLLLRFDMKDGQTNTLSPFIILVRKCQSTLLIWGLAIIYKIFRATRPRLVRAEREQHPPFVIPRMYRIWLDWEIDFFCSHPSRVSKRDRPHNMNHSIATTKNCTLRLRNNSTK